ncbi:hypothetical protein QE152_g365 [Popillia japonica]|uniref:Uncharacterized protein n=1 Tax=Popillia japonica TaxID=7064 RepID=A0AAW1NI57_POPJA
MKFLIALLPIIATTMSQRPPYAGSRPIGVPELHNRFRTEETASTTPVPLGNRLGEGSNNQIANEKIPVDALGDRELVDRLQQWPRENQPFWLLNAEAIEAHRQRQPSVDVENRFSGSETIPAKPTHHRSPFAGSSRF